MFFQQIAALAENLDVQVRIMKKGESLTVSIVPADATAIKPLSLTGTAAELDEGFLEAISAPLEAASVKDQVAAYKKQVAADLEEGKKAAATEAEKDSEKKEAAADAKPEKEPAKKRRSAKQKAEEEAAAAEKTAKIMELAKDPEKEADLPAEVTETENPAGKHEAYAPAEVETAEVVADAPAVETEEPAPAEQEQEAEEKPASDIVIDALGDTMDGSEVEAKPEGNTYAERVERFYGKSGPVVSEEPNPLPAEPAAAPDPDDSFFAPPPAMHIPFFD